MKRLIYLLIMCLAFTVAAQQDYNPQTYKKGGCEMAVSDYINPETGSVWWYAADLKKYIDNKLIPVGWYVAEPNDYLTAYNNIEFIINWKYATNDGKINEVTGHPAYYYWCYSGDITHVKFMKTRSIPSWVFPENQQKPPNTLLKVRLVKSHAPMYKSNFGQTHINSMSAATRAYLKL